MTEFTPALDKQIRDFGRMLKLQLDFAAAADLKKEDDQLEFASRNNQTAGALIRLMQVLQIKPKSDTQVMEDVVAFAEKNGSDAGLELKAQIAKVKAINEEAVKVAQERMAQKKPFSNEDLSAILKKHLKP